MYMKNWLERLGRKFITFIYYVGGMSILLSKVVGFAITTPIKRSRILEQMYKIGVSSLPIVFMTGLFTGMVLAFQTSYQLYKISAQMYIASLVALSMTRELGPVLTSLVVAGRVGASITAELGTMKVTEQIDALESHAVNPIRYLIVPKFLAFIVMLPLLTVYADFVGMLGGYIIGVGRLGIGSSLYIRMTYEPLVLKDIFSGFIKSFFFAIIICIVSSYEGLRTEGGAEGVGIATTISVVISFILIIAFDCLFTALFYFMF